LDLSVLSRNKTQKYQVGKSRVSETRKNVNVKIEGPTHVGLLFYIKGHPFITPGWSTKLSAFKFWNIYGMTFVKK
jgi:hypothetical protein